MFQLKHGMQFFIEMDMNSPCHTMQHFNYVQEERASKEAVIFILQIKRKKNQIQNSLLQVKELTVSEELKCGSVYTFLVRNQSGLMRRLERQHLKMC